MAAILSRRKWVNQIAKEQEYCVLSPVVVAFAEQASRISKYVPSVPFRWSLLLGSCWLLSVLSSKTQTHTHTDAQCYRLICTNMLHNALNYTHLNLICSLICTCVYVHGCWAPSQYPKRRLFVRSRKVSKPRDWYFKLSYRFEIWQAHRQHCCRSACQISERSGNYKYKSRGFETLRDLTKRRLFGYWDRALVPELIANSFHFCRLLLHVST